MDLSLLDKIEDEGIERLKLVISKLRPETMKFEKLAEVLLQRYWISQEFTHIYDAGQDRLTLQAIAARPTIRRIIREEYPNDRGAWRTPSHREDLVSDLLNVGISWGQFIKSRKSRATNITITSAKNIIYSSAQQPFPNLRIIAFLRYWGEVLTAVEYAQLYPRIKRQLSETPSAFYEHHMVHDARRYSLIDLTSSRGAITHADKLGRQLVDLIRLEDSTVSAVATVTKITELAIENKLYFYDQF
ncbi:MAG: hypothetical protein IPK92_17505 [Nitrospira sp.]|jgi:hypothetical protein|nr:hypothetical protein [Nitrospira sp.]